MSFNRQAVVMVLGVLALVGLLASPGSAALTDGLQSYWNFDGNGNDSQGSVNLTEVDGKVPGKGIHSTVSYVAGLVGQAFLTIGGGDPAGGGGDHTDSYMENTAPGNYNVTDQVTLSYWYKQQCATSANCFPEGEHHPEYADTPDFHQYHFAQADTSGFISYTKFSGMGRNGISPNGKQSIYGVFEKADVWQHRVFRVDKPGNLRDMWYARETDVDHGSADASGTLPLDIVIDGTATLKIGWTLVGSNRSIDFQYDEMAVWNRALSDAEIEVLFDLGKDGNIIPEPGTLALLGLGALGVLVRRRKEISHLS